MKTAANPLPPRHTNKASLLWLLASLSLFILLAVLVSYPVITRLSDFSVLSRFADTLLQAWTLRWDVHALLGGPAGLQNFWQANIFYPYPLTLAFSEHLLATALLLMPLTLLGSTPLVPANLGIIFTTALSGWGMVLLVTWLTGNRWAGLIAGLFFAISPFRMGHLVHLNLLSTHWLPFVFLASARLIKLNKNKDLLLLIIFANLQFFSVINYATMVALALAVWLIFHLIFYRRQISRSLLLRLALFGGVTFALNWPVFQIYQQMSEQMGVVRTLGDARILANSLAHYLKPMANSLLYARWLNWPTLLDSAFPGLVVIGLALAGLILIFKSRANRYLVGLSLTLLVIILLGFTLSFGANELAFGEKLAPLVAPLLPYPYLYELLPFFKGFRVPARFGLLVTFGLAILAGVGLAELGRYFGSKSRPAGLVAGAIVLLIFVEHFPAPLPGESVEFGGEVYAWLADRPDSSVALELPYYLHTDQSELPRVYQSAGHWQRLVNGNSGFEPAWLVKMGPLLDGFPDWRSFDLARRLGVNYLLLHRREYQPQDWDNLVALLPGYLPAIEAIYSPGDDLILKLKPPLCAGDVSQIKADAGAFPDLTISNQSSATFVADPNRASRVVVGRNESRFLEPLFVSPGQSVTLTVPVAELSDVAGWQIELANLGYTLTADQPASPSPAEPSFDVDRLQPVQIPFANGAVLQAIALGNSVETCGQIELTLAWSFPAYAGETVRVELIDRFNRVVQSSDSRPAAGTETFSSVHRLPLAETVPPGLYQLRVRLLDSAGTDILPIGADGAPVTQPIARPIVLHPSAQLAATNLAALSPLPGGAVRFSNGLQLVAAGLSPEQLRTGEWLRFTLAWQPEQPLETDLTVFTQLLGPDGRVWGQQDNQPYGGWYGLTLWRPDQPVLDDYAFRIDPAAPPGTYRLIVGLYQPDTLARLSTQTGADFAEIGQVVVAE